MRVVVLPPHIVLYLRISAFVSLVLLQVSRWHRITAKGRYYLRELGLTFLLLIPIALLYFVVLVGVFFSVPGLENLVLPVYLGGGLAIGLPFFFRHKIRGTQSERQGNSLSKLEYQFATVLERLSGLWSTLDRCPR